MTCPTTSISNRGMSVEAGMPLALIAPRNPVAFECSYTAAFRPTIFNSCPSLTGGDLEEFCLVDAPRIEIERAGAEVAAGFSKEKNT